jgi:hypothetical protein
MVGGDKPNGLVLKQRGANCTPFFLPSDVVHYNNIYASINAEHSI